ncbi:hypothetical protein IW261DRAFT_1504675 [Armillaria novae-zelandiae]|uniref:Uncharacterized protein n=1 Tax=Armillaria novae-zelandiae TaxID=153914 RepID=A0AA39U8E1_9AGAR|nr:hypothetical protein IW261DRAFT_1504675 [Armillaria novae-zelandiae]
MALPLPDDKTDDKSNDKAHDKADKKSDDKSKDKPANHTSKVDNNTTIQSALHPMLLQIDSKAPDRFVTASPIGPTTFGTADQIQSNYALAHIADRPFARTKYSTWGAAYTAFLLDTGTDDLPSYAAQNSLIVRYYNILGRLAVYQTKLMKAYQADVGGETTNIGVSAYAGVTPADPVSLRKMEEWARGEIVKAELEGCEDDFPDYDDQTLANLGMWTSSCYIATLAWSTARWWSSGEAGQSPGFVCPCLDCDYYQRDSPRRGVLQRRLPAILRTQLGGERTMKIHPRRRGDAKPRRNGRPRRKSRQHSAPWQQQYPIPPPLPPPLLSK